MQRASLWRILLTTCCMIGIQFTWTIELAYGTPYLLSLNLSKESTALVWLAGPISGFIVAPLIGAVSDNATFRIGRRRPFIIMGGIVVIGSLLCISYSKELTAAILGKSVASAPSSEDNHLTIIIAVVSIYVLDFSLNVVQATCRSLFIDSFDIDQQDTVNASAGALSNLTAIFGYLTGYMDLAQLIPSFLGGGSTQIKAFCNIGVMLFVLSMAITCFSTHESRYLPSPSDQQLRKTNIFKIMIFIWRNIRGLPSSIQRLCVVLFFSWLSWFPILLYSTTWVAAIYHQTNDGDWEKGTRIGSFALMIHATVAFVAGLVLPWLTHRHVMTMKTVYTCSLVILGVTMLCSYWAQSVFSATLLLSLMGVSWTCTLWIPFALVGEYSYHDQQQKEDEKDVISLDSSADQDPSSEKHRTVQTLNVGVTLGIINIFQVIPQFLVSLLASLIFLIRHLDLQRQQGQGQQQEVGINEDATRDVVGISWVFILGGVMAIVAAGFTRRLLDV